MTPRTRRICVAVPVWRGADYVAETLESVLRQRGPELTVVVSVDGADETSEAACRPFLADPRVRIHVQPRRLGWVGNSSAALVSAAAEPADYACLQPHDDVLEDGYLAALLAAAEANPDAAVVYSDIQSFGTLDRVIRQPTIAGSPLERQMSLLSDHFAAVSFRGLTRVSALRSILPMTGNPCENFAADTVWMARQALVGDLVRVPYALYRKRFHPNNTHTKWFAWPHERRMTAWIRHCLDMLAEALKTSRTQSERRMLHRAARMRLLQEATSTGPYLEDRARLNRLARARMRSRFEAAAARRADVGLPEPGGRFRVGSRAVSALAHILAGRTLQDLVDN
jgi:glycosyltransferase involved in cell wall biosynthesis